MNSHFQETKIGRFQGVRTKLPLPQGFGHQPGLILRLKLECAIPSLLGNLNALKRVHSFKRGRNSATNVIFTANRVKLLSGICVTIELTTYTAEKWCDIIKACPKYKFLLSHILEGREVGF